MADLAGRLLACSGMFDPLAASSRVRLEALTSELSRRSTTVEPWHV